MNIKLKIRTLVAVLLCLATYTSSATDYYVATTGNLTNNGLSLETAFLTVAQAIAASVPGDVINISSGTYTSTTPINLTKNNITLKGTFATIAERPILDFSAMVLSSSNYGIRVNKVTHCYIYGLIIKGAGDNGMIVEASDFNTIELCDFLENRDSGLQFKTGAKNNKVINCDSYFNEDPAQGNADGFANKLDQGGFNSFRGCRAWQNSDDGWDGLPKDQMYFPSDTMINCWCYKNGYLKSGAASVGNGNGFKLGGNSLIHDQVVINCLSVLNRSKGFDYNNNKGTMEIYNCTAYGNGGIGNFAFPNSVAQDKSIILKNCLSFDSKHGSIHGTGIQVTNSWQMTPFSVSADDFLSVDHTQMLLPRKEDGSLPDITFMHLAPGSELIDAGTNIGFQFRGQSPDLGCFESAGILGVHDDDITSNIRLFPNPAKDLLHIESAVMLQKLSIYNAQGTLLIQYMGLGNSDYKIDVSGLKPGVYTLLFQSDDKNVFRKIVIEK